MPVLSTWILSTNGDEEMSEGQMKERIGRIVKNIQDGYNTESYEEVIATAKKEFYAVRNFWLKLGFRSYALDDTIKKWFGPEEVNK